MNKNYLLQLAVLLLPLSVAAQTAPHPEDYTAGMTIKFKYISVSGPGNAGINQTWNFSGAVPSGNDTLVQTVIANPIAGSNPFPTADLLIIGSDSVNQFIKKSSGTTNLLGTTSYNIVSYDSLLLAIRPLTLTSNATDSFIVNYTNVWATTGKGIVHITTDGTGTLMLPGTTYITVTRVKITQFETDLVTSGPPDSAVYNKTSYVWYDNNHVAPVMRYDSVYTTQAIQPHTIVTARYRIEESKLGVDNVTSDANDFNAYIVNNTVVVNGSFEVGAQYRLAVYNITGQTVGVETVRPNGREYKWNMASQLPAGQYIISLEQTGSGVKKNMKVVKIEQ